MCVYVCVCVCVCVWMCVYVCVCACVCVCTNDANGFFEMVKDAVIRLPAGGSNDWPFLVIATKAEKWAAS